jgi:hypothetical protein
MDQMMDAGEEQIKSPNPMTAPSAMLSKLKSLSGASPAGMQRQPRDGRAAVIAPRPAPTKIAASRLTCQAIDRGSNTPDSGLAAAPRSRFRIRPPTTSDVKQRPGCCFEITRVKIQRAVGKFGEIHLYVSIRMLNFVRVATRLVRFSRTDCSPAGP